jgi:nicotinate phosphoribosyltransferase
MFDANLWFNESGRSSVFNLSVRNTKHPYLINAGLEQALNHVANVKPSFLKQYLVNHGLGSIAHTQLSNLVFNGSIYAMKEGEVFFNFEPQLQLHGSFDSIQFLESLLLQTINRQTSVATSANEVRKITDARLIDGSSRRVTSPDDSLYVSRASIIGGFDVSSNLLYGYTYDVPVGGTMGHSYVLMQDNEWQAFEKQARFHKRSVVFLLDTYNFFNALEKVVSVAKKHNLKTFGVRLDSGDIETQIKEIRKKESQFNFSINIIVSSGFNPEKIKNLETSGCKPNAYLIGNYLANPPVNADAVLKIAEKENRDKSGTTKCYKTSETEGKKTIPGAVNVVRYYDNDGFAIKDVVGLFNSKEPNDTPQKYLPEGCSYYRFLLNKVFENGNCFVNFDNEYIKSAKQFRKSELEKFRDIANYTVEFSDSVKV